MNTRNLVMKFGTSRGAETYGYGLVTLTENGTRVAKTSGGGYDMRGTVFGEWLEKNYADRLRALRPEVVEPYGCCAGYVHAPRAAGLYGIVWRPDGSASLDGSCGFESMRHLAEKIGLTVRTVDAGKRCDVLCVEDSRA